MYFNIISTMALDVCILNNQLIVKSLQLHVVTNTFVILTILFLQCIIILPIPFLFCVFFKFQSIASLSSDSVIE